MTVKVGQKHRTKNGVDIEIIKTGLNHASGSQYRAVGVLDTGSVMYFSEDGKCPGSPSYDLQTPMTTGYIRVFEGPEMERAKSKVVPFSYPEEL